MGYIHCQGYGRWHSDSVVVYVEVAAVAVDYVSDELVVVIGYCAAIIVTRIKLLKSEVGAI